MKQYDCMLVDARNTIYRAIYAGMGDPEFESRGNDFLVIYFRFISTYINRFHPKTVHLFWDTPKEKLWRRKLYPEYKEGRDSSHDGKYANVDEHLERCTQICQELAPVINCRNYQSPKQEADDLIFAFCRSKPGQKIIISSDGDFKQIPYMYSNVDQYSPMNKTHEIYPVEEVDPVEVKCFMGDKLSDNIPGYYLIGEARAKQLVLDADKRDEFFKVHGMGKYLLNRALIDLTLCPYLLDNIRIIDEVMRQKVCFDLKAVRDIIQKYKVKGLSGEINRSILPFKFLGC